MKCIIPNQNVKIIARGIHSLAKIGDEMFMEPTENELIFRTVNMAKSAFAEFRMWKSFFSFFQFDDSVDESALCKITMKSCLTVFKNVHGMEKQVESCEIRMKPDATVVIFQIKFTNSHVKKYYLPIIESEKLEASVPAQADNCLMASSKFLATIVKNFRYSEDEITITVEKDKTFIKNHLELHKDQRFMRTELCFHPSEFESYVVGNPTFVTFCFKELRAVLSFAEPSNLSVQISFEKPGRPILFQVMNHPAYEVNYVVSTLNASHNNSNKSVMRTSSINSTNRRSLDTSRQESDINGRNTSTPPANIIREERLLEKSPILGKEADLSGKSNISKINFENDVRLEANMNVELVEEPLATSNTYIPTVSDNIHSEYDEIPSHEFNDINNSLLLSDGKTQNMSLESVKPAQEFVKLVFKRCFKRKLLALETLKGQNVLSPDTDDEI